MSPQLTAPIRQIQQAAEKNKMKPIEFCDKVSESFKSLCQAANIEYSSFERTTNPHHKKAVNELWVSGLRWREYACILMQAPTEPTLGKRLSLQGKT